MAIFNETYCQLCDRFITKEQWNKHLYSSRHLHRDVNSCWPAFFRQMKLTRDDGMKLEKAFWERIFITEDCIEVYDFLKFYFRMCIKINNYIPVRPWFGDENEDEQWRCGYRVVMIAQFEQDYITKISLFKIKVKTMKFVNLENRIEIWFNKISNAQDPVPDNLYDYDYNDEGLNCSLRGADMFPEIGELKNLLDILRYKWLRKKNQNIYQRNLF